jgi:hypothetical protein
MWVSDKTITKLAGVLHVEAYQLLMPIRPDETPTTGASGRKKLLSDLEDKVVRIIRQQFREAIEISEVEKSGIN